MRKNMLRILLFWVAICLYLIMNVSISLAQCGADGTQPCSPTLNKTTKVKKSQTTRNKSSKKKDNSSLNLKRNQRYGFMVMYKNSPEIQKTANQIRGILLKYGFKQQKFSRVPATDQDQLYAYGRKANNSYLSFDSSVPLDVREKVIRLIQEVLPDVHIDIMDKAADDYFLLWIT